MHTFRQFTQVIPPLNTTTVNIDTNLYYWSIYTKNRTDPIEIKISTSQSVDLNNNISLSSGGFVCIPVNTRHISILNTSLTNSVEVYLIGTTAPIYINYGNNSEVTINPENPLPVTIDNTVSTEIVNTPQVSIFQSDPFLVTVENTTPIDVNISNIPSVTIAPPLAVTVNNFPSSYPVYFSSVPDVTIKPKSGYIPEVINSVVSVSNGNNFTSTGFLNYTVYTVPAGYILKITNVVLQKTSGVASFAMIQIGGIYHYQVNTPVTSTVYPYAALSYADSEVSILGVANVTTQPCNLNCQISGVLIPKT